MGNDKDWSRLQANSSGAVPVNSDGRATDKDSERFVLSKPTPMTGQDWALGVFALLVLCGLCWLLLRSMV
jgi:hypothetical protein